MKRVTPVVKVLVVVSAVTAGMTDPALAQSERRQVVLDTEVTELATVYTNGQTYVVYAYDNLLSYASGIEVYTEGERVTSRAVVDEVFQSLARRQATKFQPEVDTIARLRRVVNRSQTVQSATQGAIDALNQTLTYRQQLKETEVNGTVAWDLVIEESAAIEDSFVAGFRGSFEAQQLRNRLQTIQQSSATLEANAKRVIELLQRRQSGAEINQSDLYRRYDTVSADLKTMKTQVDEARQQLQTVAEDSRMAAKQAGSLPRISPQLETRLTTLADTLHASTRPMRDAGSALVDLRGALPEVTTNAQYQAVLTNRWEKRQNAPLKVFATMGEGFLLMVAAGLAIFES